MTSDCTSCIMASGLVPHSRCPHLGPLCQLLTSRRPVSRGHSIRCGVLEIIRQNIGSLDGSRKIQKESRLLRAIQGTRQGLDTSAEQKAEILAAVEDLVEAGAGSATASSSKINATWKLLWTTEKETLFILKQARRFGTDRGEVYQVIDVPGGALNNVITFQNGAAFIVDSSLDLDSENPQRLNFKFSGAKLKLPKRTISLPPFGKGWFDTVYLGSKIRVAKDIRGDTLVVERDGPPRSFE